MTATQNGNSISTVTDDQGAYVFSNLSEGTWRIKVELRGFNSLERDLPAPGATEWQLTMLPIEQISGKTVAIAAVPAPRKASRSSQDVPAESNDIPAEFASRAADALLVNGSTSNTAASASHLSPAFGNNRTALPWRYTGSLGLLASHSALDARPFSLTGQLTPRPAYAKLTALASLGGPIRIPGLIRNGPSFTLLAEWTRNRNVTTETGLMPTSAERAGDFSQSLTPQGTPVQVLDPSTGFPVPANRINPTRISQQARALLALFPLPNFNGQARYNFQVPLVAGLHRESLLFRTGRLIKGRHNLNVAWQHESTRSDAPNLFSFRATSAQSQKVGTLAWRQFFNPRFFLTFNYQYTRARLGNQPFFANRTNISGLAGIGGNNQDPLNWGPPSLNFADGISPVGEAQYSTNANHIHSLSADGYRALGLHSLTFGFQFRRQQWNALGQQDARGTFHFTGAAAGSGFAGFLFGIPDTASIAFGNADKYFRANSWTTYISDDWRVMSGLTLNLGARWEYHSPVTERYGRLVNLATANHFSSANPVIARDFGTLIQPDRNNVAPRFGFAWRPLVGSTMIFRGGYGVYFDASIYHSIALQMAQQAPLSISLRVRNSPENPLTLANGFRVSPGITPTTFAIDPDYRTGYAQNWQVSLQRDLPFAMQFVATYLGVKGTRAVQQILPNTYPAAVTNPCWSCPTGFSYMMSNGNSSRHAGTLLVRRRLRRGFAGEVQYTWAKAIDNAALAGNGFLIAQNWRDLGSERALSNFDQRHLVGVQWEYSTGASSGLGFLTAGRAGVFFREWTFASRLEAGTGLPLTPMVLSAVSGTGVTGSIRAHYTGADLYAAPPGLALNPAAFAAPGPGEWGNAGRNTITGPSQFTWNASVSRTFRLGDRLNGDLRVDLSNVLNHPVYRAWNTIVTGAQFGLPTAAGPMRTAQTNLRLRF